MIVRFLIAVLFIFISNELDAQCCAAGNPAGGDVTLEGQQESLLRLFVFYDYSLSKDYFSGTSQVEMPSMKNSYFDFLNFTAIYGITNRWSIHTEAGYFINKVQNLRIQNQDRQIKAHGFGDIGVNARYDVYQSFNPSVRWIVSGGVRFPVGAFNEEMNGAMIPVALQPSSGAFKYNANSYTSYQFPNTRFGIFTFIMFEYSSTIRKDFLVHRYGNYFQLAFAGTFQASDNIFIIGRLWGEWRGQDIRDDQYSVISSGSNLILFSPRVFLNFQENWQFISTIDIPLYKNVNGYQLTKFGSLQIGLSHSFRLGSN